MDLTHRLALLCSEVPGAFVIAFLCLQSNEMCQSLSVEHIIDVCYLYCVVRLLI